MGSHSAISCEEETTGFRRPGLILCLDPGVAVPRGGDEFSLSLPTRIRQDFRQSLIVREKNFQRRGRPRRFPSLFAGYTHRF